MQHKHPIPLDPSVEVHANKDKKILKMDLFSFCGVFLSLFFCSFSPFNFFRCFFFLLFFLF